MMQTDNSISPNQLVLAAFMLMLSPALRLFPSAAAAWAGKGAWLSALLAFPAAAAYLWLARRGALLRREGEGLCELIARAAPGRAGRMALAVLALWLCVYAGFVLRSGADRFLVTVYPNTPAAFFILTMAGAALWAAYAPLHQAARTVKLLFPAVGLILALVLLSSLGRLRAENLLPLSLDDAPGVLAGSLAALDVLLWSFYAAAMLLPGIRKGSISYFPLQARSRLRLRPCRGKRRRPQIRRRCPVLSPLFLFRRPPRTAARRPAGADALPLGPLPPRRSVKGAAGPLRRGFGGLCAALGAGRKEPAAALRYRHPRRESFLCAGVLSSAAGPGQKKGHHITI